MKDFARHLSLAAALVLPGCGNEDPAFFFGNPAQGPVAVNDTFSLLGNAVLNGVVTTNDIPNSGTISSFQNPSTRGGTVSLNALGQFTYTPPLNQSNVSDTFTYTLSNNLSNSTATVTINLGARGLFVKNDVANTGNGSQASPFKTLAEAVAAANGVEGAQIVLFRGDGTATGQSIAVPLGLNQGISSLEETNPANITGPVILSSGNGVRNLRVAGSAGPAVLGNGAANATLSGLQIESSAGNGITLLNCTGSVTVSNSTFRNLPGIGVLAGSEAGSLVWSVSNCAFANVTGRGANALCQFAASHNVTVSNTTSSQGGSGEFVSVDALGTGTIGLTVSNVTVDGGASRTRGVGVLALNTAKVVALLSANNITDCTNQGILLLSGSNSTVRARLNGNRLSGNAARDSFRALASGNGNLGLIFQNNLGELFSLLQTETSILAVESLDQFNAASNNTGTLVPLGTISNAAAGSLNIPRRF